MALDRSLFRLLLLLIAAALSYVNIFRPAHQVLLAATAKNKKGSSASQNINPLQQETEQDKVLPKNASFHTAEPDKQLLPKNKEQEKPILILHVGPPKTGTSSIQCTLQTTPFLNESNYKYIGKWQNGCTPGRYPLQNEHAVKRSNFWILGAVFSKKKVSCRNMKVTLAGARRNQQNAIISAEEFSGMRQADEETWEGIQYALSSYTNLTQVIVTYRHLHEVIVSNYFEGIVVATLKRSWNEPAIISFPDWWAQEINNAATWRERLGFSKLVASFEKHSYNVSVFDFHGYMSGGRKDETGDMVTRFICSLPHASATCDAYKEDIKGAGGGTPVSRRSMKDYVQFDRIATASHARGLLSAGLKRLDVVDAIEQHVEKLGTKYTDLPLQCSTGEESNQILALSIEEGRAVWKDDFDEAALRAAFEAYKEKKSFCAVDVDALLKDSAWINFFRDQITSNGATNTTVSRRLLALDGFS